jgi:hypothetical protein
MRRVWLTKKRLHSEEQKRNSLAEKNTAKQKGDRIN